MNQSPPAASTLAATPDAEARLGLAPAGRAAGRTALSGRALVKELTAGFFAAVVLASNIVSFAALMFPGPLAIGIPTAVWALLVGSAVGGAWIAWTTSLRPIATGIDSPTGTVLVLLSASIGHAVLAAGGTAEAAVQSILLSFTVATLLTGALLYGFGWAGWASNLRFVPYFVVGGFLTSTGVLLVAGGLRMTSGLAPSAMVVSSAWTPGEIGRTLCAAGVLAVLLVLRRLARSALALPIALLVLCAVAWIALAAFGLSGRDSGWFVHSAGTMTVWLPFAYTGGPEFSWGLRIRLLPELLAVSFVALVSLVTKVASIEAIRQTSGDLNHEFRGHGIANLAAAPLGGLTSALQLSTSRLLEQVGGVGRMSGVACAVFLGLAAVVNLDLLRLIPVPIVAGLVFYLGYISIVDALWRPLLQRAWMDVILAIGIAVLCVCYGYLVGVIAGLICACLLFAVSYARLGVVHRHATRAEFSGYVDRSPEASARLREEGESIQVYWLAGYLFFGSSEGLFDRVRNDVAGQRAGGRAWAILDFSLVSGADSSGIASLVKLRNHFSAHELELVCCAVPPALGARLKHRGFFGGMNAPQVFGDVRQALAWCEERLLAKAARSAQSEAGFETWLQKQLRLDAPVAEFIAYLQRKEVEGGVVLYRQGDPSDTVDLVAAGGLSIEIQEGGAKRCIHRIATHAMVGEMGFFRRSSRSASVSSEGPAVLYTMTRANFERLQRERPELAGAFTELVVRVLSDRLEVLAQT